MPNTFNSNTFLSTYRDDFADSDNYYRVLFNSGRALQARELTQLQTIIQSEIARFGSYVFKDGAVVNSGGYEIKTDLQYVANLTTTAGDPLSLDEQQKLDFVGVTLSGPGPDNFTATVVEVATDTEKGTVLYLSYDDTSSSGGSEIPAFSPGDQLSGGPGGLTVQVGQLSADVGFGTKIYVAEGSFYVNGHFVYVEAQDIFLSRFTNQEVNAVVGFKVTEDIITVSDTDNLYDNQGLTPNRAAPGADRYRIRLTLTTQDSIGDLDSETFIFYVEVADSVAVEELQQEDQLSQVRDILAERTKEESGDYIVNPFRIRFDEDSDRDYIQLKVEPGTAYVNGYRAEHTDNTPLRILKPRDSAQFENETIIIRYGNYCEVSSTSSGGLIAPFSKVDLKNGSNTTVGTAFIKAYSSEGSKVLAHLFDIQMDPGVLFNDVASVEDQSSSFYKFTLANVGVLREVDDDTSVFSHASYVRPIRIAPQSLIVQRYLLQQSESSGNQIAGFPNLTALSETYTDTSDWIVYQSNGLRVTDFTVNLTNDGNDVSIQGAGVQNNTFYTVIYYVEKTSATSTEKIRTISTGSTAQLDSDGSGGDIRISSGVVDVTKLINVWYGNADSDSISSTSLLDRFELDAGVKDNYYDESLFRLKNGQTVPSSTIYYSYEHFIIGATNDFFNFNSYGASGTEEYDRIGTHRTKSGRTYELRDAFDFRSYIDPVTRTFINVQEVPKRGVTLRYDGTYNKARMDKLAIGEDGLIQIVTGEQNIQPNPPQDVANTLTLYDITLPPYTINSTDVSVQQKDYKRYTMRDISQLEKRINILEEKTSLSILELQADRIQLTDSNGNLLIKTGFFVDDFRDQSKTYDKKVVGGKTISNEDYRASFGAPRANVVRPRSFENDVTLKFIPELSSNYKIAGDLVFPYYTSDSGELVNQNMISNYENVNPFNVVSKEGYLRLSPSSDFWRDTRRAADKIIDGGVQINADQALLFNAQEWDWSGRDPATLRPGDVLLAETDTRPLLDITFTPGEPGLTFGGESSVGGTPGTWSIDVIGSTTTTTVDRVVSNEVIREVVDDRVVETALIPWCRSRLIYFRANGLKPNRRYFPFFDGQSVSQWCRMRDFKTMNDRRIANETIDYGNRYRSINVTQLPLFGGPGDLVSDTVGDLEGVFWLPNTGPLYRLWAQYKRLLVTYPNLQARLANIGTQFRTGVLEFLLNDVNSSDKKKGLSNASSFYVAKGVLRIKQRTVKSTRHIEIRGSRSRTTRRFSRPRDPLAQSFFVNEKYVGGVHVTGGKIYVRDKDPSVPLEIQIREVVNGTPVTDPIPGAICYLKPSDITLPGDKTDLNNVRNSGTQFTFDEPVYLSPSTYYAIVLLANSNKYNVYYAKTEEFLLGDNTRRITKQAHTGSFFRSQNGSTWTPDQASDLSFNLDIANFVDNAVLYFGNEKVPSEAIDITEEEQESQLGPIAFNSGSATITIKQESSGLSVGDKVRITALDSGTYGGVFTESDLIDSNFTVTKSDGRFFQIGTPGGTAATNDKRQGGSSVEVSKNILYDIFRPEISTLVPSELCSVDYKVKQTRGFSYSQSDDVAILGKGNRETTYSPVKMRDNNYRENPGIIFNEWNVDKIRENNLPISDGITQDFSMIYRVQLNSGEGPKQKKTVSPYVDLERCHVSFISNLVDNQDSVASGGGFNVPVNFVSETSNEGGSSLAKHITKPVTLIDGATAIRLYLGADRPSGTSIDLYYRLGDADEDIVQKSWILLEPNVAPKFSDPSPNTPSKYGTFEYSIGDDQVGADEFYQFQFKFVMNSENSCVVPKLYDFRALATV